MARKFASRVHSGAAEVIDLHISLTIQPVEKGGPGAAAGPGGRWVAVRASLAWGYCGRRRGRRRDPRRPARPRAASPAPFAEQPFEILTGRNAVRGGPGGDAAAHRPGSLT